MMRTQVTQFVQAGPLPSESSDVAAIEQAQRRLEAIDPPVTDEEAQLLAQCFGPDDCFGLAWTLLHLIETAPGARTAEYPGTPENPWVDLLHARVANWRGESASQHG